MMYNNIFDTHAHYDDSRFKGELDEVFAMLKENGVTNVINCGCDYKSSFKSIDMASQNEFLAVLELQDQLPVVCVSSVHCTSQNLIKSIKMAVNGFPLMVFL